MLKALIMAAQNNVSAAPMEFLSRDPLSWMRCLRLELGPPTPYEIAMRPLRKKMSKAGVILRSFVLSDIRPFTGRVCSALN